MNDEIRISDGITLREYYAALAMNGLLSDHKTLNDLRKLTDSTHIRCRKIANLAVQYANALIYELERD